MKMQKTQKAMITALAFFSCLFFYTKLHIINKDDSDLISIKRWQENLFLETITLTTATEQKTNTQSLPEGHRRFDLFSSFIECPRKEQVERYGGDEDGGKMLCPSVLKANPCIIYSLGSNGDFSFENSILSRTDCHVYTFDCTVDGTSLHERHQYVKLCLGNEKSQHTEPDKWITLPNAMKRLGHSQLTLLKIDIEGAEYDVLGALKSSFSLPKMIAVEIHYIGLYYGTQSYTNATDWSNLFWPLHEVSTSEMALFVQHLVYLGYGIVSREDNPTCPHCTELTLVRVDTQ